MPTIAQVLSDIDLRYRNTFTTAQKLVWLNEEQVELFDILEIDSPPYAFVTVEGANFYPFPQGFDVTKIKTVTMEVSDSYFREVDFKRNDDHQYGSGIWYTIISDAMFLNYPGTVPGDRKVYIYCDAEPTEVTTDQLNNALDLPVKYQEILKLGVLKRIAAARKDIEFHNNYEAEREQKITDMMWERKQAEPEFSQPNDMMPKIRRWY